LYEMATGRPPYRAETPMAVVIKHIHDPLPLPHEINPQISDGLEQIIIKSLAKNRQDRFQSCAELVQAIQSLSDSEYDIPPPASPTAVTLVEETAAQTDTDDSRLAVEAISPVLQQVRMPDQTRQKSSWLPWIVTAVVMTGFGLIAIFVVWFILNSLKEKTNDLSVSEQLLLTNTAAHAQENIVIPLSTVTQTPKPTLVMSTETPVLTEMPTRTQQPTEPVLGIGDTLISDLDGSLMVYIPAGEFVMGADVDDPNADSDEFPQMTVYLDAFWMDQFEVTNLQYQSCVRAGECNPPANTESATRFSYYGNAEFDDYPVVNITWFDAKDFCQWRGARLPTEAEWEKAARGNEGYIYPWGNRFEVNHANYCASSILCPDEPEDGFEDTAPTGSFIAGVSFFGVQDMAGNVNEWVADWYDENYYDQISEGINNPQGPASGKKRGIRGGSAALNETKLRTTNRGSSQPSQYGFYDGFRCAQTP
jgi:formylglycine-generating enzyme required for sulfatase activity